jgi:hypothetical protein
MALSFAQGGLHCTKIYNAIVVVIAMSPKRASKSVVAFVFRGLYLKLYENFNRPR